MPLKILRQDITKIHADAIVNTTNEKMIGYNGVDLAVHKAAGKELDAECASLVPLKPGTAKITSAYKLDAKYVIHTFGPVWKGGDFGEEALLKSCYTESLKLASANNCESAAFPLISAGAYGFPKDRVLKIAVQVITEFLFENELTVYLCVFDRTSYEFSKKLFADISEFIGDEYVSERENRPSNEPRFGRTGHPKCADMPEMSVCAARPAAMADCADGQSLEEYMKSMDKSFAYKLFDLIDKRGMTDIECYKKANVDRKTFSKIKSNPKTYKPSKQTAVAFAIALKLTLEETQDLLASAGMTLSDSFKFDMIIRYFIRNGIYDVFEINEALFEFEQVLLGA